MRNYYQTCDGIIPLEVYGDGLLYNNDPKSETAFHSYEARCCTLLPDYFEWQVVEIRENSILVYTGKDTTIEGGKYFRLLVAKYEDSEGIYFLNGQLKKQYAKRYNTQGFKSAFVFGSMEEMKDEITRANQKEKRIASKRDHQDSGLYETSGGALMVCDFEGGRLDDFGFYDTYHYKGKFPTKKEIKALYDEVVGSGAKEFFITYDCMVRSWYSWEEKFGGGSSEPNDTDFVSVVLLRNYY